jgi:thiosulfate dehydrogenase
MIQLWRLALAVLVCSIGGMVQVADAQNGLSAGNFHPPPERAIPDTPLGRAIRFGEDIFRHTRAAAPAFVGNELACSNCHIDAGRLADAAPMWAAWVAFPAYRNKNERVNTFAERLQGCFRYSMNGKRPPLGDKVLVALESYSAWLARGAPTGAEMPGRGYPRLPKPALPPDYARGESLYAARCATALTGPASRPRDRWHFRRYGGGTPTIGGPA